MFRRSVRVKWENSKLLSRNYQIIWNNKFLFHDKKSRYRRDIVSSGFVNIEDLLSSHNSFTDSTNPLVNPEQKLFLMSLINSIPVDWRSLLKASNDVLVFDTTPKSQLLERKTVIWYLFLTPFLNRSSPYQLFVQQKQIPSTAKQQF